MRLDLIGESDERPASWCLRAVTHTLAHAGIAHEYFIPEWKQELAALKKDPKPFEHILGKLRSYKTYTAFATWRDLGHSHIVDFRLAAHVRPLTC